MAKLNFIHILSLFAIPIIGYVSEEVRRSFHPAGVALGLYWEYTRYLNFFVLLVIFTLLIQIFYCRMGSRNVEHIKWSAVIWGGYDLLIVVSFLLEITSDITV